MQTVSTFAENQLLYKYAADPKMRAAVARKWPEVEDQYRGVFGQRTRAEVTELDKYIALQCIAGVQSGGIWVTRIDLGEEPHPDRDIEANAAAMSDLPEPFVGIFSPGLGTIAGVADGHITWDGDAIGELGISQNVPMSVRGILPLEVGTMNPGKSYLYLFGGGLGFARWPYGSPLLWVFRCTDSWVRERAALRSESPTQQPQTS